MMKIVDEQIRRITISEVPSLDPIRVAIEDLAFGKGRITIECYGSAWSCFWGSMGCSIIDFFCSCDKHYLACKLSSLKEYIFNPHGLQESLKKELFKQRKSNEINSRQARELFDEILSINEDCSVELLYHTKSDLMVSLLGDDWHLTSLQTKENPDYNYLTRIIKTVQEALKELKEQQNDNNFVRF